MRRPTKSGTLDYQLEVSTNQSVNSENEIESLNGEIIVSKLNTDCNYVKLRERLQQVLKHNDFTLRYLYDKKIKIQTYATRDFRNVQTLLKKNKMSIFTRIYRVRSSPSNTL